MLGVDLRFANSFGATRTSHGLPHVRKQCLFVLEEEAKLAALVLESVARLPLLFLAHLLLARTYTIGSQIAPVVPLTDWHPARALHSTPRPTLQPPCAQTALRAIAHSSPDGIQASFQTRRSRKQGTAFNAFQTSCSAFSSAVLTAIGFFTTPRSRAQRRTAKHARHTG